MTLTTQTTCDHLPGFDSFRFAGNGAEERCVYHAGNGPAVLIMHELDGLTPSCVEPAEEIVAAGFTVYLPLLFGRPNQHFGMLVFSLCVRREFHLFAAGRRSPITDWLRDLCSHVHTLRGGPGIGLIGTCLTGRAGIRVVRLARSAGPGQLPAFASDRPVPKREVSSGSWNRSGRHRRCEDPGLGSRYRHTRFPLFIRLRVSCRAVRRGQAEVRRSLQTDDLSDARPKAWVVALVSLGTNGNPPPRRARVSSRAGARRAVIAYLRERLLASQELIVQGIPGEQPPPQRALAEP